MGNLVPQQRVDRNGKLVTRHVKIDNPTGNQRSSFPSLVNTGQSHRAEARKLIDTLDEKTNYPSTNPQATAGIIASTFSKETLRTVNEIVEPFSRQESNIFMLELKSICQSSEGMRRIPAFSPEPRLHYAAEMTPILVGFSGIPDEDDILRNELGDIRMAVRSKYKEYADTPILFREDAERAVIRGIAACYEMTEEFPKSIKLPELARIGRELDRFQPYAATISSYYRAVEEYPMMDDSTLEWLSSNIETVEQYSGTLRGRGRMGCSALEELVNGESPSLAAGQL